MSLEEEDTISAKGFFKVICLKDFSVLVWNLENLPHLLNSLAKTLSKLHVFIPLVDLWLTLN